VYEVLWVVWVHTQTYVQNMSSRGCSLSDYFSHKYVFQFLDADWKAKMYMKSHKSLLYNNEKSLVYNNEKYSNYTSSRLLYCLSTRPILKSKYVMCLFK
jgi:hypothetical protein